MQVHRSASWSVDLQKAVIYNCIKKDRLVRLAAVSAWRRQCLCPQSAAATEITPNEFTALIL